MAKLIACFIFGIATVSIANAAITYECYPELSGGNEVLMVVLDYEKMTASLLVDGSIVKQVENVAFTEINNIGDYCCDDAQAIIGTDKKSQITLSRDYDELVLDISKLNLGLSDTRYMCD